MNHPKPPRGVKPVKIWKQERAVALVAAIEQYVSNGFIGGHYVNLLTEWMDELKTLLFEINEVSLQKED